MTSRASQHYPPRTASKPRLCTAGHKRPWKYRVPLAWIHSLLCLAGKITEHAYITTWVYKFCHVGGGIWLVIKCHAPFGLFILTTKTGEMEEMSLSPRQQAIFAQRKLLDIYNKTCLWFASYREVFLGLEEIVLWRKPVLTFILYLSVHFLFWWGIVYIYI